jgi:hypothetical protein
LCVVDTQELTVFASVTSTSDVIPIKETAVQAGAAYVGEGCYCQFGNELVQVVSLLHEGETFLVDEIDDKSQAIRCESTSCLRAKCLPCFAAMHPSLRQYGPEVAPGSMT